MTKTAVSITLQLPNESINYSDEFDNHNNIKIPQHKKLDSDHRRALDQYNAVKQFLSYNSIPVLKQYEKKVDEPGLKPMISNQWNQQRVKSHHSR